MVDQRLPQMALLFVGIDATYDDYRNFLRICGVGSKDLESPVFEMAINLAREELHKSDPLKQRISRRGSQLRTLQIMIATTEGRALMRECLANADADHLREILGLRVAEQKTP